MAVIKYRITPDGEWLEIPTIQGPQGEPGKDGPQGPAGPQGEPGPAPDMSDYYTKEEVDTAISTAIGNIKVADEVNY